MPNKTILTDECLEKVTGGVYISKLGKEMSASEFINYFNENSSDFNPVNPILDISEILGFINEANATLLEIPTMMQSCFKIAGFPGNYHLLSQATINVPSIDEAVLHNNETTYIGK